MHLLALALAFACGDPTPGDSGGSAPSRNFDYPLDDVLRFNHLQAKGTHNSYHVETTEIDAWHYTHAPLDEQLGYQGVRQFELDTYWDAEAGAWAVYHVEVVDEGSTCPSLGECLDDLRAWSDEHPAHHPLFTLIEVKEPYESATAPERLAALEEEVLAAWPEDRLVTPALVQGDSPSLREALASTGWPTLGELRGRALFVLHDGGDWRTLMTDGLASATGPLFPDAFGDLDLDIAAVHSMNDPTDPSIGDVVAAGHLVRTRCDSDTEEARAGDTSHRDAALASGAHFVSTDFPVPVDWTAYWVDVPGGTPSRCNPLTAPAECTSEAIEDPEYVSD